MPARPPATDVHLSAILVIAAPDRLEACRRQLESLPGVEVHHADAASGRLIAVLESDTLVGQTAGLRRMQELEAVRLAALVEHRIDEPPADGTEVEEPPAAPAAEVRQP